MHTKPLSLSVLYSFLPSGDHLFLYLCVCVVLSRILWLFSRFTMAVARQAAVVAIKQEPPDSSVASLNQRENLQATSAEEGHMHSVEPKPVHPVELDERILNLCSQYPKGITDDIIMQDQPQINTEQRMKALQRLLSQARVLLREVCQVGGGNPVGSVFVFENVIK